MRRAGLAVWALVGIAVLAPLSAARAQAREEATVVALEGVVDPLLARYVERSLRQAIDDADVAVLVRIDTPGGLDSAMRSIVKSIEAARVPVACWVGPAGARAASAGAIIALGCPVVTMAPGTNVGAAHPVGFRGEVLDQKVTNDAAAYARALAEQHGRDPKVAERMVRESVSLSAREAVATGFADAIAADARAALRALEGRTLSAGTGATAVAPGALERVALRRAGMSFVESLLHRAVDPNVAFLFLSLGLLGIAAEIMSPGIQAGGIVGGLSLLAALVVLGMLPVNLAGVLLVILGVALMVIEAYVPGGIAGVLGACAVLGGGLFLFDASVPGARVSRALLLAVAIALAAFFFVIARVLVRARRQPPASATAETLIGELGVVERRLAPTGIVRARGESWSARSAGEEIDAGAAVVVTAVEGLTVVVQPAADRTEIET